MGSSLSLEEAYSILNMKIIFISSVAVSFVLLILWFYADSFFGGNTQTHLIHLSYERKIISYLKSEYETHPHYILSLFSLSILFSQPSSILG